MEGLLFKIAITLCLFLIGWAFGRHIEAKHFKSLAEAEQQLAYIEMDTQRFQTSEYPGQLVSSNVVISHDYFKYIIASIQSFFGGRLNVYETITERARREAIVRLKREAEKIGATQIMGLRLSTTEIGSEGGMVEVFAYGTAIQKPRLNT